MGIVLEESRRQPNMSKNWFLFEVEKLEGRSGWRHCVVIIGFLKKKTWAVHHEFLRRRGGCCEEEGRLLRKQGGVYIPTSVGYNVGWIGWG
jgi:hypothetical protein